MPGTKIRNSRAGNQALSPRGWISHWEQLWVPSVIGNACLYCIDCTRFGQLILRKIIKIYCHQMSDFKAKMHQIRLWLGLCLRLRWGSLQRSPRPLAGFKGAASRQGGEGKETGKGRGMGRDGKTRVGEGEKGNGGGNGIMGGTG